MAAVRNSPVPTLPHRPAAAIALLSDLISTLPRAQVKLIGSSLGGFYATWLADRFDVKAALINPAVHVQNGLKSVLGPLKNYHTGEEYLFTQQHLDELAALDKPAPLRPQNLLLLVETGDEMLDYRAAVNYYAASRQIVVPGGDHGFQSFPQYYRNHSGVLNAGVHTPRVTQYVSTLRRKRQLQGRHHHHRQRFLVAGR